MDAPRNVTAKIPDFKMDNGYFKLYRKFFSHSLWEEPRTYSRAEAFLDLLQLAAFAPTKRIVRGKLIHLQLGELVASERFLVVRWNWSRTKVRSFIKLLKDDAMLDQRKDQGETILILLNYADYAKKETGKNTSDQTEDQTSEEPAKNQRRTKVEEGKEGKEGEEDVLVDLAEPKPTRPPPPYKQIVDAYNATLGGELPVCRIRNASREAAIRRMWRYLDFDMGKVQAYFRKVRESDFLCGRGKNKKNFCSFDWLLKQANITKTLEGNYDNE